MAGRAPQPKEVFRSHYGHLQQAIIAPVLLAGKLFAKQLIGAATNSKVSSVEAANINKAAWILNDVQASLEAQPRIMLRTFCDVLDDSGEPALVRIAASMRSSLDGASVRNGKQAGSSTKFLGKRSKGSCKEPSKKVMDDSKESEKKPKFEPFLNEDDLDIVVAAVRDIADAERLGLNLGIRYSALDKIKVDYPQLEGRKDRVIYCWLKRNDIVRKKQNEYPTWDALADAVASLDRALSDRIRDQYC